MATMKDVAREAGVSVATVSYYVNKKRISEKNSRKVAEAIRKLNYVVNVSGRNLRATNGSIGVVFPDISDPYPEKIISGIKGYLMHRGKKFGIELTDGDPDAETESIRGLLGRKAAGIILYTCQPKNRAIFELLAQSGIPFVVIDRKPGNFDCNFVSCDNHSLFADITSGLLAEGSRDIALVCGLAEHDENMSAYAGYADALMRAGLAAEPGRVVFTRPLRESGFRAGIGLLESSLSPPSVVLTTSYKIAEGLRYAFLVNRIHVGEDVRIITSGDSVDDIFYCDPSILKTSRPAFEIGETAARLLLKNLQSPVVFESQQIVVKDPHPPLPSNRTPDGPRPAAGAKAARTINVLLIDDYDSVNALQRLLVTFSSRENITVNIHKVLPESSYEHIIRTLRDAGSGIDAFLFDIPWLPYLAENGYFLRLDDLMAEYAVDTKHYISGALDSFGMVNGHCYALPYMSSTELLFYRRDLFTDEHLCRQFEDRYKIPLEPPRSWAQYNSIAQFFTRKLTPSSPVEYGHAMAVSYTEQVLCGFLPRLWAYGGDVFDKRGSPSLSTSAARKALRSLLESAATAHPDLLRDRPADSIKKLVTGDAAMVATFFNYATAVGDRLRSSAIGKIGWASIPDSCPTLGGWSFGISRFSANPRAAFEFITWASCEDLAVPHTILGGQSPARKAFQNYDLFSLYPWLPMALGELQGARKRRVPSIDGRPRYEEKRVEDIIASSIMPLIRDAAAGNVADSDIVDQALLSAEREIRRMRLV